LCVSVRACLCVCACVRAWCVCVCVCVCVCDLTHEICVDLTHLLVI